ncbi:hypothetical protein HanIR_Chr05g0214761 [Helianthus annuus]|nr:hypothetical protein HanIR_Chr05g0214761 [Helianthus annuus]
MRRRENALLPSRRSSDLWARFRQNSANSGQTNLKHKKMTWNRPKLTLKKQTYLKPKTRYTYAMRLAYLGPSLFRRLARRPKARPLGLAPLTTMFITN